MEEGEKSLAGNDRRTLGREREAKRQRERGRTWETKGRERNDGRSDGWKRGAVRQEWLSDKEALWRPTKLGQSLRRGRRFQGRLSEKLETRPGFTDALKSR